MPSIEVSINRDGLEEAIRAKLESDPRLRPVEIGSDSEYAFSTEFGSDGLVGKQRNKKSNSDEGRKELERLKKEISRNYGLTGAALESKAKEVHSKRIAFGQIPDPYIRPAIHQVIHEIASDGSWLSKHGMLGLGDAILERMKRILKENRTLFSEDIERHMFSDYKGSGGRHSPSMSKVSSEAIRTDDSKADGSRYNGHKGIQEGNL